jgi:hypothetical protein
MVKFVEGFRFSPRRPRSKLAAQPSANALVLMRLRQPDRVSLEAALDARSAL